MENVKGIASTLLGETRSAVLAALLLRPEQALHVRELARVTGVSPGTLHRELKTLEALGILARTQTGKQVFYAANRSCPVFEELAGLLRKTAGLVDVLRQALAPLADKIDMAFVYGSMATGQAHANSDVDVMIVGTLGFTDAVLALSTAQTALRREVNPTVFTAAEFAQKQLEPQGFVSKVWQGPKLWLMGEQIEP
jgi:DNA-binding HxlR family transcriptional regulator/predicted nucleotidyltransferase